MTPKLRVRKGLDRERLRRQARQADFMKKAAARSRDARARRRAQLLTQVADFDAAVGLYKSLAKGLPGNEVRLRPGFHRNPHRAEPVVDVEGVETFPIDTRPPATQLVNRQNRGLQVYLTAIFEAQCRTRPGARSRNDRSLIARADGWSTLAGDRDSSPRNRRLHLQRALSKLESIGLVELGPEASNRRYDAFRLMSDDASGSNYRVPGEKAIGVPASFFIDGWALVLEPREIVTFLMLNDLATRFAREHRRNGIGAVDFVRRAEYGITPEVFEAHRELAEFGLISTTDTVPNRRHGRVDPTRLTEPAELETYRFTVDGPPSGRSALATVIEALEKPAPRFEP